MEDFEKDRLIICTPDHDGEISVEIDGPDCLGCTFVPFEDLENWVKAVRAEIDENIKKGEPLVNQPMEDHHPAWIPFEKWQVGRRGLK